MDQPTQVLTAGVAAATGLVVLGAGGAVAYVLRRRPAPTAAPRPVVLPQPGLSAWFVCHTPTCGHMTTPHDRTPAGDYVCRGCGTTRKGGL